MGVFFNPGEVHFKGVDGERVLLKYTRNVILILILPRRGKHLSGRGNHSSMSFDLLRLSLSNLLVALREISSVELSLGKTPVESPETTGAGD